MPLLKQWTQLRLMLALFDFYSKTGAMGGGVMMPQQQMPPQMGNPMADMMAGAQYLMAEEPTVETSPAAVTEDDTANLVSPAKSTTQLDNAPVEDQPSLIG